MAHPKSPFSLSVGPAKQVPAHGQAQVLVTDSGTKPLAIHTEVLRLAGAHCGQAQNVVTVNPARFTLQPGAHQWTTVHLAHQIPAGDYGVLYLASAANPHQHGVTLTGAVGSQVLVRGAAVCHPKALALAPHVSAGFPWWVIAVTVALVILAGYGVTKYVRR